MLIACPYSLWANTDVVCRIWQAKSYIESVMLPIFRPSPPIFVAGRAGLHFPALAAQGVPFRHIGIMFLQGLSKYMAAFAIGDEVIKSGLFGV